MMEFERYVDGTEYNLRGPGSGVRKSKAEWIAFRKSDDAKPIYQMTDWHNSRTISSFLENQRERKHYMGGWIPKCTWVMQPPDVKGFATTKEDVADSKVVSLISHLTYPTRHFTLDTSLTNSLIGWYE